MTQLVLEGTVPGHLVREGVLVTPWEAIAYDAIKAAAESGEVCPLNLDLEDLVEANSTSTGPNLVKRLERKGLIRVKRILNKFRRVQIVATGDWTARDFRQKAPDKPHVPRGTYAHPTDRKPYRKGRL